MVVLLPRAARGGDLWNGPASPPTEDSARSIKSNPASIGRIEGTSTSLSASVGLRSMAHDTDQQTGRSTRFHGFPELAHGTDLGTDRWAFGLAVWSPWGWNSSWSGGQQGKFRSIYGEVTGVAFTPSLAYSPLPELEVGVSVSYAITSLETYRAFDFAPLVAREEGVDPSTVPRGDPGNEGREHVDMEGAQLGGSIGATWSPGAARLAAAYHSPKAGELSGDYQLHIPHNAYYRDRYLGDVERSADLDVAWPGAVELGARFPLADAVEAHLAGTWRHWGQVDDVVLDVAESEGTASLDRRLEGELNDTVSADVGVDWQMSDSLVAESRVGFATSPLPSSSVSREAVEGATLSARAGVRWSVDDALELRFGYRHRHLVPREVGDDANFGATGTYRHTMGLVDVGFSYDTK